jgi:hypothetical protein
MLDGMRHSLQFFRLSSIHPRPRIPRHQGKGAASNYHPDARVFEYVCPIHQHERNLASLPLHSIQRLPILCKIVRHAVGSRDQRTGRRSSVQGV